MSAAAQAAGTAGHDATLARIEQGLRMVTVPFPHLCGLDYDTPDYGDGADDFTIQVDFANVRNLAVQELSRRGRAGRRWRRQARR